MRRTFETTLLPSDYTKAGEILISSPPLIKTNIIELGLYGWWLSVKSTYLDKTCASIQKPMSKVKLHFHHPHDSIAFITFKVWVEGKIILREHDEKSYEIVRKILLTYDFTPRFNKVPSFNCKKIEKTVIKEEKNDLQLLEEINARQKQLLTLDRKSNHEVERLYCSEKRAQCQACLKNG